MVVVVVILVDKLRMRETYRSSLGFSYSDTYEDPEWDEQEEKNRNVNNTDVDLDPPLHMDRLIRLTKGSSAQKDLR